MDVRSRKATIFLSVWGWKLTKKAAAKMIVAGKARGRKL